MPSLEREVGSGDGSLYAGRYRFSPCVAASSIGLDPQPMGAKAVYRIIANLRSTEPCLGAWVFLMLASEPLTRVSAYKWRPRPVSSDRGLGGHSLGVTEMEKRDSSLWHTYTHKSPQMAYSPHHIHPSPSGPTLRPASLKPPPWLESYWN